MNTYSKFNRFDGFELRTTLSAIFLNTRMVDFFLSLSTSTSFFFVVFVFYVVFKITLRNIIKDYL